jgi:hypothetical protein
MMIFIFYNDEGTISDKGIKGDWCHMYFISTGEKSMMRIEALRFLDSLRLLLDFERAELNFMVH